MSTERKPEPSCNRVMKGGKSVTLKMSIGRKAFDNDKVLSRMLYEGMLVNGAQYCRPHLLTRCHLCEIDYGSINEEADEERRRLGLRPCGDAALNARADKWGTLTSSKVMEVQIQRELLVKTYGRNHLKTHPEQWQNYKKNASESERQINDEFLAEEIEVSQCCYWACEQPDAAGLRTCAGCGIVKYCCKEHQAKDWAWEHKGECKLPTFLKQEYEEDQRRYLSGNYNKRDHNGIVQLSYP